MSAALQTSAEGFLARYEGQRAHLPGDPAVRAAAAAAFRRVGLSVLHDEAWKYTRLRSLAETTFHESPAALAGGATLLAHAPAIDAPRLVFVDGRFRADLSATTDRVRMASFALAPDFGRLARPERERMVALNTMLAEDGAILDVSDGVDGGTVVLLSVGTDGHGRPVGFHPRHAIRLGRGARLTLIEVSVGQGSYLHNPVAEVLVGEAAALQHVRLQDESDTAFHLATLYAELAAGSMYDSFVLNLGARMARTEIHVRLAGPNATTHLNGAQLLRGGQHADITTVVRHDAPSCASRQTVKNVLSGHARGVFQGRIEVARGAQKTDGYQMNQALLLSPEAEIDTKPELEIYADDVKCSHGATVGELDAEQLFYLRSRGVPEAEARAILVHAFLTGAIDTVTDGAARAVLDAAIGRWWERKAA